MKKYGMFFLLLTGLLLCGIVSAELLVPASGGEAVILPLAAEEGEWYFLPAFAQETLMLDGTGFRLSDLEYDGQQGVWRGVVAGRTVHLTRGSLRSLFLYSDDPVHYGRAWVEDCAAHENETTGSMKLFSQSGELEFSEKLLQLRGRGNSTWLVPKKPYQLKLETKQDLLPGADGNEKARKWVLLAEYYDCSLLNNRIGLDLALELGLSDTSRSGSVDLYYDGEYRGVYTLCEKIEVGAGRVALSEPEEKQDAGELTPASGENAYGLEIHYYEGVNEPKDPSKIAYLTEIESGSTLDTDSCWFRLSNGGMISVKSPEYIGRDAMCYLSEKMEELWLTASSGGVHPEKGTRLSEQMDLDSFARALLIYDFLYCHDGMAYSSGFFKLESDSSVFTAGPVWDFDLGGRYLTSGRNAGGFGMHRDERKEWFSALISVPEMQRTMLRIWQEEGRDIIGELLLKDDAGKGRYLNSLSAYNQELSASRRMNVRLHGMLDSVLQKYGATIERNEALQREFFEKRLEWMNVSLGHMYTKEVDTVCLNATTDYTDAEGSFRLEVMGCFFAEAADVKLWQVSEADEQSYAVYGASARVKLMEGCAFAENVSLYVNGMAMPYETDDNGEICLTFFFEDATYRYLETDGQDIGLVLDLQWLRENRPELEQKYPTDEELLNWFAGEGMETGQRGNAYFSPRLLREYCTDWGLAGDFCYDYQSYLDWGQYEWDFTEYEDVLSLRYAPVILLP